jgi:formylglycine-generating enzyme
MKQTTITIIVLFLFCHLSADLTSEITRELNAPINLSISITLSGAEIMWDSVAEADNYLIYRTVLPDAEDWGEALDSVTETVYTDVGISESDKYFYRVTAVSTITVPPGFVYVQGGSFEMGDRYGDGEDDELPLHTVTLDDYFIAATEVTQAQFQEHMPYNTATDYGVGDDYPVHTCHWFHAVTYCNFRSSAEGLVPVYSANGDTDANSWSYPDTIDADWTANGYRLPTEAEWEYAARGGIYHANNYKFSGTTNLLQQYAWYSFNNAWTTHEVGNKLENQLDIFDMSGNVFEMCWDIYNEDYYSVSPEDNPHGADDDNFPEEGPYRVIRGGYFNADAPDCRVARRFSYWHLSHGYWVGFRLVRSIQ